MTTTNTNAPSVVDLTSSAAREILERKIESGRASAKDLFERIFSNVPTDQIAKGAAMEFAPVSKPGASALSLSLGSNAPLSIHRHALGQLASRAGVPTRYLSESVEAGGWRGELGAEILRRHYHHGEAAARFLVRSVKGEARGVMSDKYRRLDSRPLVEAFATECNAVGAVPVDGTGSDTRVAMKAIVPKVFEVPGKVRGMTEALAFGVEWSNSDYGAGLHGARAFILRLWCLNGATMENSLAQVHLGARLSDDVELSQRTYDLDTRTSISALRDVVRGILAPGRIEMMVEGIKAAQEKEIEWKNVSTKLGRRLLKGEMDAARAAFESEDVINLPAGKSVWRVSNALSWIAGQTEDADRKLDLQRLAGEVLHGKKDAELVELAA